MAPYLPPHQLIVPSLKACTDTSLIDETPPSFMTPALPASVRGCTHKSSTAKVAKMASGFAAII